MGSLQVRDADGYGAATAFGQEAHGIGLMSPTVEVEFAIVGFGIGIAVLGVSLHSSHLAVAGMLIIVLAGYAVWLDWRR
jgi:hypothetical protein